MSFNFSNFLSQEVFKMQIRLPVKKVMEIRLLVEKAQFKSVANQQDGFQKTALKGFNLRLSDASDQRSSE